jgi:hypothetical protein
VLRRIEIILKANIVNFIGSSFFVCFLVPFTELFEQGLFAGFCDRLIKSPFLTVSSSFDERCQQCVVNDGDYFKGLNTNQSINVKKLKPQF